MNAASRSRRPPAQPEPPRKGERRWSRGRWFEIGALVFAVHVGLIFAFGDFNPILPRPVQRVPVLRLASGSSELLALSDPTLFALPHRRGFGGAVWREIPPPDFQPARWTELLRWLDPPDEVPGAAFAQFMRTNVFAAFELEVVPEPALTPPGPPPLPVPAARSTVRLGGELDGRSLLSAIDLPPQPSAELLTNTVVQVLVDAAGRVSSQALLVRCGSEPAAEKADQLALELARNARFKPLHGAAKSSVGLMVFEWQSVPLPATNGTPLNP